VRTYWGPTLWNYTSARRHPARALARSGIHNATSAPSPPIRLLRVDLNNNNHTAPFGVDCIYGSRYIEIYSVAYNPLMEIQESIDLSKYLLSPNIHLT
jgi:hypothetical protein